MRLLFDRGTLLFEEPPEDFDSAGIRGVLWDPRVGRYRAPASRYDDIRSELVRRGVSFTDGVRSPAARVRRADADAPALPFRADPRDWRHVELRPYQEAAIDAWHLAGCRGLVVLPTGAGKTRVAVATMARLGGAAIAFVPTRALLDQWMRAIREHYAGPIGQFGDGERRLAPVTVATFESAWRQMAHIGDRFDLVIVDEAHHFGSGVRDEALEMCAASSRMGLSATPPRAPEAAARLAHLVGPTVYELSIGDLAGTFLADFDAVTLMLDLDPPERADHDACMTLFRSAYLQFRNYEPHGTWEDFSRAANRTEEGRRALAAWRRARRLLAFPRCKREALRVLLGRHRDARVLVFVADNETAYAVSREHLVMPITCDIGRDERDRVLQRFRDARLRVLVSARVLNEGIDVPDADVAVVVAGRLGEREHVQRVGRLLRPAPDKRAMVYELVVRNSMEVGQAQRRRESLGPRGMAAA